MKKRKKSDVFFLTMPCQFSSFHTRPLTVPRPCYLHRSLLLVHASIAFVDFLASLRSEQVAASVQGLGMFLKLPTPPNPPKHPTFQHSSVSRV